MFLLEIVIDHNLVYWAEVNHYQLPVLIEKYGRVNELQIWSLRVELTFLDLIIILKIEYNCSVLGQKGFRVFSRFREPVCKPWASI
jgi:hypothetical protein